MYHLGWQAQQHPDAIALRMPNGAAFLEVAWAAQRSGLYYSPVRPKRRPGARPGVRP